MIFLSLCGGGLCGEDHGDRRKTTSARDTSVSRETFPDAEILSRSSLPAMLWREESLSSGQMPVIGCARNICLEIRRQCPQHRALLRICAAQQFKQQRTAQRRANIGLHDADANALTRRQ